MSTTPVNPTPTQTTEPTAPAATHTTAPAPADTPPLPPTQAQKDAETAANARVAAARKELLDAEAAAALAKAKLRPALKSLDLTKPFEPRTTAVNEMTIHQGGFPLGAPLSPHDSAVVMNWLNSITRVQ